MKLHLPVLLFRLVLSLHAGVIACVQAVEIPSDYASVQVHSSGDVTEKRDASGNYAFLFQNELTISGGLVVSEFAGSRFFTSGSAESRVSLTLKNDARFEIATGNALTFSAMEGLSFCSNLATHYSSTSNNHLGYLGGSVYLCGSGNLFLSDNTRVVFSQNGALSNTSKVYGGAVYAYSGSIELKDNESIEFAGNYADAAVDQSSYGGAVYAKSGAVNFIDNESVAFNGNYTEAAESYSYGGAICTESATVTLRENRALSFSLNYALSEGSYSYGGAIYCLDGRLTLHHNGSLLFSGNHAVSAGDVARGGAIYCFAKPLVLSANEQVSFSGNYVSSPSGAYGGAISCSREEVSILENGQVTFSSNFIASEGPSDEAGGGAVYAQNITIHDNADVLFENNYERIGEYDSCSYRLRSLYAKDDISLSAAEDGSIEIRDTVYAGRNLSLNEMYTNMSGESISQTGDIIFTGAYAAESLGSLNSSYTNQELIASLTSEVLGTATLYDGRLIVRAGAVMNVGNLQVKSSASGCSSPTVLLDSATMVCGGNASFGAATTLASAGASSLISDSVTMADGAVLSLALSAQNTMTPVLCCTGSLGLSGDLTLLIFNDEQQDNTSQYKLLSVGERPLNWAAGNVSVVSGTEGWEVDFSDLLWEGDTLWLYSDIRPDLSIATWTNKDADRQWNKKSENWAQDKYDYAYSDGVHVVFGDTGAGSISLEGSLAPSSVLVHSDEDYVYLGSGSLTGSMTLTKRGSGALVIHTDNDYTGGTIIESGSIELGALRALGAGHVVLKDGELNLKDLKVENNITASGGTLSGAGQYAGKLIVSGDVFLSGNTTAAEMELQSGSITGGAIADTAIVVDSEGYMEITSRITGESSLVLNDGNLHISGANSYSGGTTINGGCLTIDCGGALGTGAITINEGTLNTNGIEVFNDVINNGGVLIASYVLGEGRTLSVGHGGTRMEGHLVLSGGTLHFNGFPLTVNGAVKVEKAVNVFVCGYSVIDRDGTIELADFGTNVTGVSADSFLNAGYGKLSYDAAAHTLSCELTEKNIWEGGRKAGWAPDSATGWEDEKTFANGNRVVFNTKGSVTITGEVEPASVLVDIEKSLTFSTKYDKKSGQFSGSVIGKGCVVKRGKGTLTMNDGNTYSGGTFIEAGTVKAKGAASFGTGDITLLGGTVNLASKVIGNDIIVDGTAAVKSGKKYTGEFTLKSGELMKGSLLNVAESATLAGGTVNGTLSGVGSVAVTGSVELGDAGKITTNALNISGTLGVGPKGLAMNSKSSVIDIDGGTLSSAGKISACGLSMTGGKLDVTNEKPMAITLKDSFSVEGGAVVSLYGGLTANALEIDDSTFTLAADFTEKAKAQTINIKGKGVQNSISGSTVDVAGKMTVTGDLKVEDSSLSLHDVAEAAKPKAQGLTVKGELEITEGSELSITGALSAAALDADDARISIAAEDGLAAQSVKLTRAQVSKGVVQDNFLTDSKMYVNGAMTVAGNLELNHSTLSLRDYSGKKKAVGLSVKGGLNLTGGSTLSMTGALSAKNLTLGSGSSLTLGGSKMSTIKVGGALDLGGAVTLNLGFTVKEADVAKGKAFTLFTFKSFAGNLDNLTLGYEGAYTLDFNAKGTGITLVIADAAAWNEYATSVQETAQKTQTAVTLKEEEENDLPVATAVRTVDPVLAGLADTLVQSTWGVAGASRAFADTVAGRGAHATLLEGGKGAAWVSVMGGSSRISSDGGHTGADFTLSGAAIGIEGNVTEKSTIGLAIGNSWGKVSPFSAYRVDQDSTHYGLYGNHALRNNLTLSWMAAHTRTESDGNLAGMDCDWTQDALQLDARLTWSRALNEKTTVSAFGGLQYLATDSADFNGLSTGSVQNLRTEIGAGITHKAAPATQVYGELSFIGDVARNNPTATVGDYRTRGANPGRVGINLHIGAAHQLNDSWSVNAGYSFELQKNATSHGLNVGASFMF